MLRLLQFGLFLFLIITSQAQTLFVNEIMSSNDNSITDEDGEHNDWIEIYNRSNNPIDLSTYFLTDDLDRLDKWSFPANILLPDSFVLVFASNKDRSVFGNEMHSNFKIKSGGEPIAITDGISILHLAASTSIPTNESYGLSEDGGSSFVFFTSPTPRASNIQEAQLDTITLSRTGGIYDSVFKVSVINVIASNVIRYTTNGTPPTDTSNIFPDTGIQLSTLMQSTTHLNQMQMSSPLLYNPPLFPIPLNIVLRVASFNTEGAMVSRIVTESYFIKELGIDHKDLPVLSINASHYDLIDFDSGLFVPGVHWDSNYPASTGNFMQSGDEWEREVNIEYYHPNNSEYFNQNCGLRLHGLGSRHAAQKAMRFYARKKYKKSKFEAQIFEHKNFTSFKRLMVKPMSASWSQSGFTDYLSSQLAFSTEADILDGTPIIVYVNGEYWGIYFIHERLDERYLKQNHPEIEKDSIDIIESWHGLTSEGSNINFTKLYEFINDNDLADSQNYEKVKNWIDIPNFIDYQFFEMFIANYDWPDNNLKCWRERKNGEKWRWIFFDGDGALQNKQFDGFSFALDTNGVGWPTNPHATLFLRKLMKNDEFYAQFWGRVEVLLDTILHSSTTIPVLETLQNSLLNEIKDQSNRFSDPLSESSWTQNALFIKSFLIERGCVMATLARRLFDNQLLQNHCYAPSNIPPNYNIFPNPTSSSFTYSMHASKEYNSTIILTDMLGKTIFQKNIELTTGLNEIKVDLKTLNISHGLYYFTIHSEYDNHTVKLVYN